MRVTRWESLTSALSFLAGSAATERYIKLTNAEARHSMYTILQNPLVYNGRQHKMQQVEMV